jgi:DNA mismatch repair protein MutS2
MALAMLLSTILAQVDRIIDDKTQVRDTASQELGRIRKEKTRLQASVEGTILRSFRLARQQGWTPDDAEVTIRNGRLVIPLISTHKRKLQGFVHDESATGHTVFVEPAELFETNNEIRELGYAERREIVRILIAFAGVLRPHTEELAGAYRFLGKIDFIRAKAQLALMINGTLPVFHPSSLPGRKGEPIPLAFSWKQALHPLLFLSHRKQKKEVVPLEISLDTDQRILIISGPNAGGKSVCLKTVGLVQYMFQCGLLPPVREDSEFCIFHRIFIDIGDEQSIDNDLSTYTSKLINLKHFIENIDDRSLFLIDEMGSGTDPSLGGAIAEATLEAMNAKNAMGVVTTHYSNLKLLASREQGIVNGAMLYDMGKMRPMFRLSIGKPGSSFALEIARAIGFPDEVLQNAGRKTGRSQLDFDRELQNLEVEKEEVHKKSRELTVADDFLAELIGKYEKLNADLEARKKEIITRAREEAQQLLDDSNRLIEKTIREIREAQAEKERTKAVRTALSEHKGKLLQDKLSGETEARNPDPGPAPSPQFMVGSEARPHRVQSYVDDLNARIINFTLTLDLRGSRVDDALISLQRYIDDAILCSIPEVRILHGKGNGVLRQVTRDYLKTQKEVKSFRDAPLESGGAGITVVNFR